MSAPEPRIVNTQLVSPNEPVASTAPTSSVSQLLDGAPASDAEASDEITDSPAASTAVTT